MAKRIVKSLNKTGRISRKDARKAAIALRDKLIASGKAASKSKITRKTTASGRGEIAFHVTGENKTRNRSAKSEARNSA